MANVIFEHVTKKFGEVVAVNDLDLEIKDKEFLVLVGPSGCGKSTALRMVAGLETITDGNIYISDRLVNDIPPKDRDIAMVFQSYALYPHMNVFDNLAFGLKMRKTPRDEIKRRVNQAADILDIGGLLNRKPKELSGGQRQRVALGRAIVREPKVFLMDEPLSNLDAKLRVQTRAEIIKLHERLQTTFIYVTHDQVEAMTMADRISVLKNGILQQLDTPQNLYDHPANMFVAGFIGSPAMNFLEVNLIDKDRNVWSKGENFELKIPGSFKERLLPFRDRKIILGIRPEDISDKHFHPDTTPDRTMKVKVDVVEPMGSEVYITFLVGKKSFTARMDSRTQTKIGADMEIVINMEKIHTFDPATEKALT